MKNPYDKYPVMIQSVTNETEDKNLKTFELTFLSPDNAQFFTFVPGQFAMLWVPGYGEIPLGIASSPTETNKLLFSVNKIGKVTRRLHQLNPGAILGVRGPFGNGFPWGTLKGKRIAIIGGGYAFTTLRASLVYLLDEDRRNDFGDLWVLYGARNPGMLMYREEMEAWAARDDLEMLITVDQQDTPAWPHHVGLIPTVVAAHLPPADEDAAVIVCGPPVMIKFTLQALHEKGYGAEQIYLSLENRMKCGIGFCGRCSVGKDCVCRDGPVFSSAEVNLMPNDF